MRLRRAVVKATQAAQQAGEVYLAQQVPQEQSTTLTPFRPGPKGREAVLAQPAPLFKTEPLIKPVRLLESTPLVEARPLIDRPMPVVKGTWRPSPGQLRELALVAVKAFNETMRREA
jgi:hypothetical protein